MPRKIEIRHPSGVWVEWGVPGTPPEGSYPWRYVGGVLEFLARSGSQWLRLSDGQERTVEEAKAKHPGTVFRLRPYDDGLITSDEEIPAERLLSGTLAAERQKQHAARPTMAQESVSASRAPLGASDVPKATEATVRLYARLCQLSDTCGALKTELDEAYAKIGRLEREVERLGRKR